MADATSLSGAQQKAIFNIKSQAISLRQDAVPLIKHILQMSNVPLSELELVRDAIRKHARVAVHFHPDRPVGDEGLAVSASLLRDGVYKSQFETGISNGSVSAYTGGFRDEWERKLFGGAYHEQQEPDAVDKTRQQWTKSSMKDQVFSKMAAGDRPKYGALDLIGHPDGPAPRFGSCYLILKPHILERSTFTFGGSQSDPKYQGIIDELDGILGALMEECFQRDFALGVSNIRPAELVERLKHIDRHVNYHHRNNNSISSSRPSRNLDHVIEAQIHGQILMQRDVEALVADPSFEGTAVGNDLRELCEKNGIKLLHHGGFNLKVGDVPSNFRGPGMPSLASRIAVDGTLNVSAIGTAVRDAVKNHGDWTDRGTPAEVLQEFKLLWHVLVRYGQPLEQ